MKINQMLQNGEYLLINGSLPLKVIKVKRLLRLVAGTSPIGMCRP